MLNFHLNNLGNQQHCRQAYGHRLGVEIVVMSSVAEVLCQTESISEDLLFSDAAKRIFRLIQGGYVEIVNGKQPLIVSHVTAQNRYRLTNKGNQALKSAASKPYAEVGEIVSSSMHVDEGIAPQQRQAYQEILDAETSKRRSQKLFLQSEQHISEAKAALERMFQQSLSYDHDKFLNDRPPE